MAANDWRLQAPHGGLRFAYSAMTYFPNERQIAGPLVDPSVEGKRVPLRLLPLQRERSYAAVLDSRSTFGCHQEAA